MRFKNLAEKIMNMNENLAVFLLWISSRIFVYFSEYFWVKHFNLSDTFFTMMARWDAIWYKSVFNRYHEINDISLTNGFYSEANWAFFPLFPKLIKLLHFVVPLDFYILAQLFNNILLFFTGLIFYKVLRMYFDKKVALYTLGFFMFSFASLYYSAPYTESLFSFLIISSYYLMKKEKWLQSGVMIALAGATRSIGVFFVFVLLFNILKKFKFKDLITLKENALLPALAIFISPLGLFLYMLFLYIKTGDPLAFYHIEISWHRGVFEWERFLNSIYQFPFHDFVIFAYTAVSFKLIQEKKFDLFFWNMACLILPLLSGHIFSIQRYSMTVFSIYIASGYVFKDKNVLFKTCLMVLWVFILFYFIKYWAIRSTVAV